MTPRRRVLVVDDSAVLRRLLCGLLSAHPGLEVVGECGDPYEAREKIRELDPDVLTLDVEMPRMDGLTFLRKLMRAHPMPVVMLSSLTAAGTETALEALAIGAVDVVGKPRIAEIQDLGPAGQDIAETVYAASFARAPARPPVVLDRALAHAPRKAGRSLIAIGASTGGTEALRELFEALPGDLPPIAVVQHILPGFVDAFAQRLDRGCAARVKVATHGERAEPGTIYFAPSQVHLAIAGSAARPSLELVEGGRVSRHQPSVDVLFRSAAMVCGPQACGVILTGMGSDGADGLFRMAQTGADTVGQDEATCVVYGMPKVAFQLGAVKTQLPLNAIPAHLARWARGG